MGKGGHSEISDGGRENSSQNYSKTLTWVRPCASVCPQNTPNSIPPVVTTEKWDTIATAEEAMGAERMAGKSGRRKKQYMEVSKEEEGDCYLLLQALLKVCQKC